MSEAPDLPLWAAILVSALILVGSAFTLIGSFGLARLRNFYDRAHAPTIGSSAGVGLIALASIVCFSILGSRFVFQEAMLFIFVSLTMPVTLMLLARASLFRDRAEGNPEVPPVTVPPVTSPSPSALPEPGLATPVEPVAAPAKQPVPREDKSGD